MLKIKKPTLAVGMTSVRRKHGRRGLAYIYKSLESFRESGFDETVFIFSEPESYDLSGVDNVIKYKNKTRLGCFRNWKNAATRLVNEVEADWYLMLQDDVIFGKNCASKLKRAVKYNQDVGFLSSYASKKMVVAGSEGWVDAEYKHCRQGLVGYIGALALCFPRASLVNLLDHELFVNHKHHRKVDQIVGLCFKEMDMPCKIHVPSLCDHAGKISSLGLHLIHPAENRRGYRFLEEME